jgi:SEC-C motif-containing protein
MKDCDRGALDCPCGRRRGQGVAPLLACCGPRLAGFQPAPDAEALMRSRYTAYVQGDRNYLLATWHGSTRPASLDLDPVVRWLGLEVKSHQSTGADRAEVVFVARYRSAGRGVRLHERSRFVRENGCWFYLDGDVT